MAPVLLLALLLLLLAAALPIAFLWLNKSDKLSKLPPGSNGVVPLIGETIAFFKATPAYTVGEFMECHMSRYGKVFSSNLMGKQAVVSADAEMNRFVQKNDMKLFSTVLMPSFLEIFGGRNSLPLAVGEKHRELRSLYSEFLSARRIRTVFLEDADNFASRLIDSWQDGSVISVVDESLKYSLEISAKSTLGIIPEDPLLEVLQRNFKPVEVGLVSLPINFPGTNYWKALKARKHVINLVLEVLEERRQLLSKADFEAGEREEGEAGDANGGGEDLLYLLLKRNKYSEEDIANFILMMIFAGHDTSAKAIAAMVYFLAECPKAIKTLQEEHHEIIKSKQEGETSLSWKDYKKMEFTECVINETLRLTSVAPFMLRQAVEDVKYNGFVIPRGCLMVAHIRAVHLDANYYENPEEFNPWRWLDSSSVEEKKNFMPFGGGVRMCPGSAAAKLEMALFLHHFILKYEWELAEPDKPMSLPSINFPKGLPIKIHSTGFK